MIGSPGADLTASGAAVEIVGGFPSADLFDPQWLRRLDFQPVVMGDIAVFPAAVGFDIDERAIAP